MRQVLNIVLKKVKICLGQRNEDGAKPSSDRFKSNGRKPCCARAEWRPLMDLGESGSFDFFLGRCAVCGKYLMHVWRMGTEEYLEVAPEDAERFQNAGPERKKILHDWFWER